MCAYMYYIRRLKLIEGKIKRSLFPRNWNWVFILVTRKSLFFHLFFNLKSLEKKILFGILVTFCGNLFLVHIRLHLVNHRMTDGKWKALFLPFRKQLLTVPQSFWKVTWCRDPVITSSFQLPVCWLPKAAPLPCCCWKTRWRWCENLNGDACDSLSYLKYEKATAE